VDAKFREEHPILGEIVGGSRANKKRRATLKRRKTLKRKN